MWAYLPSWIATIRPVTPSSTRSIATLAKVVATSESIEVRLAAAQVVGQLRGERLDPGPLAQLVGQRLADVRLVAMPERVGVADVGHLGALPDRALGGDDEGVVARVGGVVLRRAARPARRGRSGASGITQRADVTYAVYSAENPASRPKIRNTPIRSCEPSVVRWRLIASLARVIAVEKPMQYSVPWTSLSIVFGMATSGTPALARTCE